CTAASASSGRVMPHILMRVTAFLPAQAFFPFAASHSSIISKLHKYKPSGTLESFEGMESDFGRSRSSGILTSHPVFIDSTLAKQYFAACKYYLNLGS
ncbi:MAG: hypothetical protein ABI479_02125, partial [Gallionella sp.]